MRLTLLPVLGESDESLAPHLVFPPQDNEDTFRIAVYKSEEDIRYFNVPDLASLLEVLNRDEDTFARTTWHALNVVQELVDRYLKQIWSTRDEEIPGGSEGLRQEIVELVRLCCAQERALLIAAKTCIDKALR